MVAGALHGALALAAVGSTVWGAVSVAGGRCTDTASCLEANAYVALFLMVASAAGLSIWAVVLSWLLRRVSGAGASRWSSAVVANFSAGVALVVVSLPLDGWRETTAVLLAMVVLPAAVTWWAAAPDDGYVPLWRRTGW